MTTRYYLSDVIGTGTIDDPYRPILSDVPSEEGEARSFVVSQDLLQALCVADRINHAALIAARGIDPLPDSPLDLKLNAIRTATVSTVESRINARGFDKTWANSDAFRDILQSLGQQIDANFQVDNFGPQ